MPQRSKRRSWVLRTASGSMKSLMKIANRQWADWCTSLHYRNPQWWPEKYGKLMRMGGPSLQVPLKFHGLLRCHQFLSSLRSYIQSRSSVSVICLHENTIVSLYSTSSRCTSTQKKVLMGKDRKSTQLYTQNVGYCWAKPSVKGSIGQ